MLSFFVTVSKLAGGNVLATVLTLISTLLIANWVSPQYMGLWNTAQLIVIYSPLLQLGFFNGLNRELPVLFGTGDKNRAIEIASVGLSWALLLFFLTTLLGIVSAGYLLLKTGDLLIASLVSTVAMIIAFSWISQFLSVLHTSHSQFNLISLNTICMAFLGLLLTALVAGFGIGGLLVRAFILGAVGWCILVVAVPIRPKIAWRWNSFFFAIRKGFPILLIGQLSSFLFSMDRLALSKDPVSIGLYTATLQVESVCFMITTSISAVLYPDLAKRLAAGASAISLWKQCLRVTIPAILISLFIGIIGFLSLPIIVQTILPNYVLGIPSTQLAAFVAVASALSIFNILYNILGMLRFHVATFILSCGVFWSSWIILEKTVPDRSMVNAITSLMISVSFSGVLTLPLSYWLCHRYDKKLGSFEPKG